MQYSTVESLVSDVFGHGEVAAIGLADLARRLGVHPVTLRRACRSGRLAAVNIGGRWRVGRDALAAYLADGLRNRPHKTPPTYYPPPDLSDIPAVDFDDEPPPLEDVDTEFLPAPDDGYPPPPNLCGPLGSRRGWPVF